MSSLYNANAPMETGGRHQRNRHEGGSTAARVACDFFIFLDMLASIAFIIAGLCPISWISYTTTTDSSTTNSSFPAYYFTRYRGLFYICPNSLQNTVNAAGCSMLDMGNNNPPSNDPQYWNIISMRRVEVAFFIISVVLTGIAVLVHGFCCIPHCRHEAGNGYWKNGIASGVLSGFAAAFQLIGMIVYQADIYYEATYSGVNCLDCWGYWPTSITSVTQVVFGAGYALGWCAAGLLVYASVAYLSREFCVVRGCRPPESNDSDFQNLDGMSGASSSAPYTKGAARDQQFSQVSNAPRLQRYDVGARAQPDPYYPQLYSRPEPTY